MVCEDRPAVRPDERKEIMLCRNQMTSRRSCKVLSKSDARRREHRKLSTGPDVLSLSTKGHSFKRIRKPDYVDLRPVINSPSNHEIATPPSVVNECCLMRAKCGRVSGFFSRTKTVVGKIARLCDIHQAQRAETAIVSRSEIINHGRQQ